MFWRHSMSVKAGLESSYVAYDHEIEKNGDHQAALRAAISVYMMSMIGKRGAQPTDVAPQGLPEHYLAMVSGQDRRYVLAKGLFNYEERTVLCYYPDQTKSVMHPLFVEVKSKDELIDLKGRPFDVEIDKTDA